MLKWKALAIAGVAFGLAGVGWGYAQQQVFPGFYELRIYKAQPGKRDSLAARFATRTSAIYQRHGITNVGYFIPQQSVPNWASTPPTHSSTYAATHRKRNATSG